MLKLLALKWAVTEKLKDYLWGATDHRPLLHLRTARLGALEQRWVAQLTNFNFSLCHKLGVEHQNADALSRLPGSTAAKLRGTWAGAGGADMEGEAAGRPRIGSSSGCSLTQDPLR